MELLISGVPPLIVAATGGWTSMAFTLYWTRVESIIPAFTARAYAAKDMERAGCFVKKFAASEKVENPSTYLP